MTCPRGRRTLPARLGAGRKVLPAGLQDFTLFRQDGSEILLVTYGRIFTNVRKAANILKGMGIPASVLKLTRIKPIDSECAALAADYQSIYFFEEGIRWGGIGESFGSMLIENGFSGKYKLTAIQDFVPTCSVQTGLRSVGLDTDSIVRLISKGCGSAGMEGPWVRTV